MAASCPSTGLGTPDGELLGLDTQEEYFYFGGVGVNPSVPFSLLGFQLCLWRWVRFLAPGAAFSIDSSWPAKMTEQGLEVLENGGRLSPVYQEVKFAQASCSPFSDL